MLVLLANLIPYRRIEKGIKRDALLTAQASGRLGKCQAEARRATLPT